MSLILGLLKQFVILAVVCTSLQITKTRPSPQSEQNQARLDALLTLLKLGKPTSWDPVHLAGHLPALEIYKVPDPRVRVEGAVGAIGNSTAVSLGSRDWFKVAVVYATSSRPVGVELKFPGFFLPDDSRDLEVWHQGKLLFRCSMPSTTALCNYNFDYTRQANVGRRFTVRAVSASDRSMVLQSERVYAPLPYMCSASIYSRQDIEVVDCSKIRSFPKPIVSLARTSNRGFAVELEFMAKDNTLKVPAFGEPALERVKTCVDQKVAGSAFTSLSSRWNWEVEEAMEPFKKRDGVGKGEYVGWMVELTSPGPPSVLAGDEGIRDVARVYHTLGNLGTQIGLWAQLHVHVNALSATANPASTRTTLTSDQIINIWTAWSMFQMVIDEMQSSTNVDNLWAKPLYMDDLLARWVFSNMWSVRGTGLDPALACETFYGQGNCDGKGKHGWTPPGWTGTEFAHGPPRYYAVNLAPLTQKGTIEFRQQAGTNDAERAQRWVQFVLAFVETFKNANLDFLFDGPIEQDIADLNEFQRQASFSSLFDLLGQRIDSRSSDYYEQRRWMKAAPHFQHFDPKCSYGQ
jgi:hypothetical protein